MSRTKAATSAVALAPLILAAGCAGNQAVPTASIEQAEQRIDEAEEADAQRYANQELNMAREKLLQAREAQEDGDEELAARLAQHAELDAAYAIAHSDNEGVQEAVNELRTTIATLESELERQQGSALAPDEDADVDVSLRDDIDTEPADEPVPDRLDDDPLAPDSLGSDLPGSDPLRPDLESESPDDAAPERGL